MVKAVTGESQMDQLLTLFKAPATIRDIKETFLYVTVFANTLSKNPLYYKYPEGTQFVDNTLTPIAQLPDLPPYYAPLNTTRTFTIGNQINSLLDLRIPKDKYMVQIQMVECLLECDSSNWVKSLNEYDLPVTSTQVQTGLTYDLDYLYQPDPTGVFPPAAAIPQVGIATPIYRVARKRSIPSPLYCRIRELNDVGEPYQWSVSNSGQVSLDKQHNIITKFGDVHYSKLTLEFGHILFLGKDEQYRQFGMREISRNPSPVGRDYLNWNPVSIPPSIISGRSQSNIEGYTDYEYLDYNREWTNSDAINGRENMANTVYVQPASRGNDFILADNLVKPASASVAEVRVASTPLKTNQQASNITFRFSIKLIHMF